MPQVESRLMKGLPRQTQSIMAAGLLAILTLFVFSLAQFGGPESALRLYHAAAATRDTEALRTLVLKDPAGPSAQQLQSMIERLLSGGTNAQILSVRRVGRDATLNVVYQSPQYGTVAMQFYVRKPGSRWLVDADATWRLASRM
ncbi:MAG: hypothetical protein IH945_01370 [Armatimonadetes bacterium]|nr:hypothetical protein [Armatimonadota bacterium]